MNNRYLLITLFSFGHLISSYAQNYLFSIGPIYSTFSYQNYNKSDWNNYPDSYPTGGSQLDGSSIGARFQVPLSDILLIKSGFNYSKQKQEHTTYTVSLADTASKIYAYNTDIVLKFNMIQVPFYISYNQEIGYKSDFYINIYAGPQISFLTNYESSYIDYAYDDINSRILYDSIRNYILNTPEKFYQKMIVGNPPVYEETYREVPYLYNKILLGISGGIEFQKIINERILLGIGFFSEYDFTNSENESTPIYPYLGGRYNNDRAKSHNFRIGLTLTAQYVFY